MFVVDRVLYALVVTNLEMKSGRVLWEGRGAWKLVANAGFSATRAKSSRVGVTTSPDGYPTWCTEHHDVRSFFESITCSLGSNPVLV